ncbi:MAG: IPT/TIG domain-containing protein, partial [Nanoarchaeota archaeon]
MPNFSGTIPKGSTIVFSLWIKKTADFGAMHPLAKLYLNNATGTLLCSAAGSSPLTTTLFSHTFTCTTLTDIAVTSQDRFYLWVGVNMTAGPSANRVKAELDIEGTLNGNYDSFVGVSQHIVTNISPTSGGVGTDVTITGLNFGATQGISFVSFNGTQASASSWSYTAIVATVPSGVSLSIGLVTVTVNGITGNGLPFSVPLRSGYITTVAGSGSTIFSGDGRPAPSAGISAADLAVDSEGNLYIASGSRIRKVDTYGTITTIAGTGESGYSGDGGPAIYAKLFSALGLAMDSMGNLYIAEGIGHRIRKVSIDGTISTVAGSGIAGYSGDGALAISAQLANPSGVAVDNQGNLFIADKYNHCVRKVSADGIITTIAGIGGGGGGYYGDGGPATNAWLYYPSKVTVDNAGNLFIADTQNNRVRKVDTSGIITTVLGTGSFTVLYYPEGIAVDAQGNLYVSDMGHDRVLKVTPDGSTTRYAGNGIYSSYGDGGPATSAAIAAPTGLALDAEGNLFIVDWGSRIRKVGGKITPVINSLSPAAGPVGTLVTISGSRFGAAQGTSTVTFNGILATPTSWSDTSIVVPVPAAASTGPVVVTVGGMSSTGVTFTVTPKIISLSPSSGQVGTVVSISGYNFGASQGTSTVTFNGITAAPLTWSNTTITVPVPSGASTGPVVVTVNGMGSNEIIFTVTVPMPPEITSLSPASGPANSTIIINGANFG